MRSVPCLKRSSAPLPFRLALPVLALGGLLMGPWTPAAGASGDPVIRFEGQTTLELDLGMIVDDLLPLFLDEGEAENPEWTERMESLLDLLGVRALDRMTVHSYASVRKSGSEVTITLDRDAGGFLPALAAVPPARFAFGRYLDPDETAAVVSFQNFSEGLKTLAALLADAGIPELSRGITRSADGDLMMGELNLDRDLFPYIEGELDFVLFPMYPGEWSEILPNLALVLGTPDGPALREHALDVLGRSMGDDVEESREVVGEQAGEFTIYPLHEDMVYAVGPRFLIVTNDEERLTELLMHPGRGLDAPKGRQYVRIDGDLLLDILADAVEAKGEGSEEGRIQAELLRAVGEQPIGVVEIMTSSRAGRIQMEVRQPGSLLSLEYRMFRELLAHARELETAKVDAGRYRDVTSELDEAMTRYGQDHDGVFPEDPRDLVKAGYLEAFPDLTPTPLGEYAEGAYTYVPLRDAAGTVVGYFLFVYGGGANSGFDVFTPETVSDPRPFRLESDGIRDGVSSFCYDGTAVDVMEAWREN